MELEIDKQKIKKYNYAIILGSITFFGSVIALVIVSQMIGQARKIKSEVDQKTAVYKQLSDKKDILDSLSSRETELKKNAETLATALPEDKDVGRLFIQLTGLVSESGGSIRGITAGSAEASVTDVGSTLNKYSLTLPITFNNYESVKTFFDKTDNALRLMSISSISLSSENGGTTNANITINTYSRK